MTPQPPLVLTMGAVAAVVAAVAAAGSTADVSPPPREVVNFDFAWRWTLGGSNHNKPSPGPAPGPVDPAKNATCATCEHGVNYGSGSAAGELQTDTYTECCTACAARSICCAWDWNPSTQNCYLKTDGMSVSKEDRWSGRMSAPPTPPPAPGPPTPPPSEIPPEAATSYNDSTWELVNAPHDMLINQGHSPSNQKGMGYIARNAGWYRKKFVLPRDWMGSTVWMYCEGSFHKTTAYLNGHLLGVHVAAYTSYWLRIDNATEVNWGGTNVIALDIDASFGTGWWYEGGGLNRHQYLVRTNSVHLAPAQPWVRMEVNSPIDERGTHVADGLIAEQATVVAATLVENTGTVVANVSLRATMYDMSEVLVGTQSSSIVAVSPGASVNVSVTMMLTDVQLWTIQRPYLYLTAFDLVNADGSIGDQVNVTAGARTVQFDANKGLILNNRKVKVRAFCDHSNFGGVGGAVPDRINLYRIQMLRSVGANAWRMAHNPPIPARLDFMDGLGMMALDENRDYGSVGTNDHEDLVQTLTDMRDLVVRDRSHPSVMAWSFCNEGECSNDSLAKPFREVAYEYDGTRPVTQNHMGKALSTEYLDIQGFSHKSGSVFDTFHSANPSKPMMATECCSCMSQRGIDTDFCPKPEDGGCEGGEAAGLPPGVFYNNDIMQCTSQQVAESDSRDFVAGTFVWSGFDYLGEARGWPQTVKCRGTVSDIAGFTKETAYWLRSWWLSNVSMDDYGKPPLAWSQDIVDGKTTIFIVDSWQPAPAVYQNKTRSIRVYTNAPAVRLEINGKVVATQSVSYFMDARFDSVLFSPGNLTAVALSATGMELGSFTRMTPGTATAAIVLSLDAPSIKTGTGASLVADGEDVAMVRATLLDSSGNLMNSAAGSDNVTFSIVSGPGQIWTTHNGDPATQSPNNVSWHVGYYGLVRCIVRTTLDAATPSWHRQRIREIDLEGNLAGIAVQEPGSEQNNNVADIVLRAEIVGSNVPAAEITIPVSSDLTQTPHYVSRMKQD